MKDYCSFAHTSIGFSHISSKKPCQDYSMHYQNDVASVIIVSDGHGSSNFTRSDRGSRFACEVTREAVDEFLENIDFNTLDNGFLRDDVVSQLCKNILLRWNMRVDADFAGDPFTDEEVEKVSDKYKQRYLNGQSVEHAYGCTLIVVVITKDFWLAIRNGDGECVCVNCEGDFDKPIPWNDNCEFNVVTSLCDADAISDFRYFYSTTLPAAVFIGSDGVDDSYTSSDELFNLYRNISLKILNEGFEAGSQTVEAILPEITRRGSTDDVSIAALVNPAALENARITMEIALEVQQIQADKARQEQQKRILMRDIKIAEKKKAKAVEQRNDVLSKLQEFKENQSSFLAQILLFKKQADACGEHMVHLEQDEKQLAEIINGADSEIERLRNELLALTGETEVCGIPNSNAASMAEPADVTVTKLDGLSGCDAEVTVRPETDDASPAQDQPTEAAPEA